jgi:hypothetical protein
VKNVHLRQNDRGQLEVTGHYTGGAEGESRIEWTATLLAKGNRAPKTVKLRPTVGKVLRPPPELTGATIEAVYVPVRADGVRGTPVTAAERVAVRAVPTITALELLTPTGEFSVAVPVRCKVTVAAGDPTFQWARRRGTDPWADIAGAVNSDYTPVQDEIGCLIRCTVSPVNGQGWIGEPRDAVIPQPVDNGVHGLVIVSHKNRFQSGVELTTSLGTDVSWEREVGNGEWEVAAEAKAVYLVTWNDVGSRLRAFVGSQESPPTPKIIIRPSLEAYVRACVRSRAFKFTLISKVGKASWTAVATEKGLSLKGPGGEKIGKWTTVTYRAIEENHTDLVLWLDPSCKFAVVASFPGDQRLTDALGQHARDFVCATLSEYAKGCQLPEK